MRHVEPQAAHVTAVHAATKNFTGHGHNLYIEISSAGTHTSKQLLHISKLVKNQKSEYSDALCALALALQLSMKVQQTCSQEICISHHIHILTNMNDNFCDEQGNMLTECQSVT